MPHLFRNSPYELGAIERTQEEEGVAPAHHDRVGSIQSGNGIPLAMQADEFHVQRCEHFPHTIGVLILLAFHGGKGGEGHFRLPLQKGCDEWLGPGEKGFTWQGAVGKEQ
mgnify:CR=1 FL=1